MPLVPRLYEVSINGTASLEEIIKELHEITARLTDINERQLDDQLPVQWEGSALFTEIY